MTDLNRKPYTIQMIQNGITLGKEEGSRKTLQSDFLPCNPQQISFRKIIKSRSSQCPLLRVGLSSKLPMRTGAARGSLEIWGKVKNIPPFYEYLILERETVLQVMMSGYMLWIKRAFLKREVGLGVFSLIIHRPWGLKGNSAVNSVLLDISNQALCLWVAYV